LSAAGSWLYEMEKFGVVPLIYTYPYFWRTLGGELATWAVKYPLALSQWPKDLWILNYTPPIFTADRIESLKTDIANGVLKPVSLKPWTTHAIWQFTARVDSHAIPGHPGEKKVVDYNAIFMELADATPTPPPTPPPTPEPHPDLGLYRVTGQSLKVFAGPGDTYRQVSQLTNNQAVNVLEIQTNRGEQWARIETPAGWCRYAYLEYVGPTAPPIPEPTPELGQYRFTGQSLKVFAGPAETYQLVGQLTNNQTVNVLEIQTSGGEKWARIDAPTGWCRYAYLKYVGPTPPPVPVPTPELGEYRFNGQSLKVFVGPGDIYRQVSMLTNGQTVNVLEVRTNRGEQWARIEAPAGWCRYAYLESVKPLTALGQYRFTGQSLKVFVGPGDIYRQVSALSNGQTVNVLDIRTNRGEQWARIDAPAGWCRYAYLEYVGPTPPPTPVPPPELGQYRFTGQSLKVFAGPADTYQQVGQLANNQTVNVLEFQTNQGEQWARLDVPAGWCRYTYLEKM
jgi:hypothetical protein